MKSIKEYLIDVREFFWPLLEGMTPREPKQYQLENVCLEPLNLNSALASILKVYESEEDRRKSVESKSSLFIGTISVITSILLGVTTVLATKSTVGTSIVLLVSLLGVLTIYMARTIWFSIEALERKHFHSISVDDYLIKGSEEEFKKKLICSIANKISKNYQTINSKVSSMTMAQEYFKRAIVVIVLYVLVILGYLLSNAEPVVFYYIKQLFSFLERYSPSLWNSLAIYTLLIWCIILIRRVNMRLKSMSNNQVNGPNGN